MFAVRLDLLTVTEYGLYEKFRISTWIRLIIRACKGKGLAVMKHSGPSQRQLRVGEQVRHAVAQILQRGELRDPLLDRVILSISEVRMSPDLRIATCFVAPLDKTGADAAVEALNRHAKFMRGKLGGSLGRLKFMPELRFRLDTSFENFTRIDALLRSPEVARDLDKNKNDEK